MAPSHKLQDLSPTKRVLAALFSAFVGMIILSGSDRELPKQHQLLESTGQVTSVTTVRGGRKRLGTVGVGFTLSGTGSEFIYSHRSGDLDTVMDSLRQPNNPLFTVTYDHSDSWYVRDGRLYQVYSITSNGKVIRSYDDVAASRTRGKVVDKLFGIFFIVGSVALVVTGFLPNTKRGPDISPAERVKRLRR